MVKIAKGKPAEFEDFIIRRRIEILKDIPGFFDKEKTLLDIGCGNGASLLLIAKYFNHCHGVDISEESINELSAKLNNNLCKNISWSLENVDKEFCEGDEFDRIISFEVLEHVGNDQQLLTEMFSKLAPGGILAITVPNKWWLFETHGAYLPLLHWNRIPFFSWLPKCIHSRFAKARIYRKGNLKTLFKNTEFEVISMNYVTAPMDVIKWRSLQNLLRSTIFQKHLTSIPFLATAIMVVCKKLD